MPHNLHVLDDCNNKMQALDSELSSTFDDTVIQAAFDAKYGTDDYKHGLSLSPLSPGVIAAMNTMDKIENRKLALDYFTKVA